MTTDFREYVITLKNKNDLDEFYEDLETPGGNLYIPSRKVECVNKRPISRNTHYLLTEKEAELIKQDPRVEDVVWVEILKISSIPFWTQTGNFSKSPTQNSTDLNWGILRSILGNQETNWGSDGTPTITTSVQFNSSGKNVDVVIIDGHIDPTHPEFTKNLDGTGGSRINQLDWFTLNPLVSSIDNDAASLLSGSYNYTPYSDINNYNLSADNNHGAHVAGTACGNRFGWAKDANIYNISPYNTNSNQLDSFIMWDYIRAFHRNKPINPTTGRKNPTICNGSYGTTILFPFNYGSFQTGPIVYAKNRNVEFLPSIDYSIPLTDEEITAAGIRVFGGVAEVPYYSPAIAADIQDAINDGIIIVAAAGNSFSKIDVVNGLDYDNLFYASYGGTLYSWYSHRGTTPAAVPGVICVGAIGTSVSEYKATFSNCGPRIDIYAPGQFINSSVNSTIGNSGVNDPRSNEYKIAKLSGTSMASPQVCGLLACVLETYPNMNQAQAKQWIIEYATKNQLTDTGGSQEDPTSLQGSPNRYMYAKKERFDYGTLTPKNNYLLRTASGAMYPRPRIRK